MNENISPFDVDHTLVLPNTAANRKLGRIVKVVDPVTLKLLEVVMHKPMVRLLLEEAYRGSFVIVWSRGGHAWASAVVEALGLMDKVDLIMTKPMAYFDDIPVEQWLLNRVYLEPGTQYKE